MRPVLLGGVAGFALTPAGRLVVAVVLALFNHDARTWMRNGIPAVTWRHP